MNWERHCPSCPIQTYTDITICNFVHTSNRYWIDDHSTKCFIFFFLALVLLKYKLFLKNYQIIILACIETVNVTFWTEQIFPFLNVIFSFFFFFGKEGEGGVLYIQILLYQTSTALTNSYVVKIAAVVTLSCKACLVYLYLW